jgi:ABC-type Mn2+/Zn2+ transport system ATPase subunit
MSNLLTIKDVTVSYDTKVVLERANLVVEENDFIGIIVQEAENSLLKAILVGSASIG